MGTAQRGLPARPRGLWRARAACRRPRVPRPALTPRCPWAGRPEHGGGGRGAAGRGCGRCARRAALRGGRTGGGGGVPLAPPSLLSGLITSVISKPGPGCECGARGGSAGRGGGRCRSLRPVAVRPCPSRAPAAVPGCPRGGCRRREGQGQPAAVPVPACGGSSVPQPPSPGLGAFPVNPPRPDTNPLSLCASTDGDETPSSGRGSCKSISWETCCWSELRVDLGAGNTRCLPRPAQGKPHFLSETPSGPEALSPGAGETDPGAAAAAAEGRKGLAHGQPQPLSIPRYSAPSHCWLLAPGILKVSSPAPPPLPPPLPIPPLAETKLFHGVFLYRGISCSPCDQPEPGAALGSVRGHTAATQRCSPFIPRALLALLLDFPMRFSAVTSVGIQAAPGTHRDTPSADEGDEGSPGAGRVSAAGPLEIPPAARAPRRRTPFVCSGEGAGSTAERE